MFRFKAKKSPGTTYFAEVALKGFKKTPEGSRSVARRKVR